MNSRLSHFFALIFISALFSFFMSLRIFSVFHVTPNLFLILGLFLLSVPREKRVGGWISFSVVSLCFLAFSFWFFGFWTHYIILLLFLLPFIHLAGKFLTGHTFFDYLIKLAIGTIIFNIFSGVLFGGEILHVIYLFEALYNMILGALLWPVLRSLRIA